MLTSEGLLDIHDRAHRSLERLLRHCLQFSDEEVNRTIEGFGYPTVRLQLHHLISAERYWVGVLQGRVDVDDTSEEYSGIASLQGYRTDVFALTESYLRAAGPDELNTPREVTTWGNRVQTLAPAHVIMRTVTHIYHHTGQIVAMCRLLGNPCSGMDYPMK